VAPLEEAVEEAATERTSCRILARLLRTGVPDGQRERRTNPERNAQ
jgi:hypothetical protein